MKTYREMYFHMANAAEKAIQILIQAQQDCEEAYLSFSEPAGKITEIKAAKKDGEEGT